MRDTSFTAPPSRNFAQRMLDRNLKPYRHMSNLWKARKGLQRMEVDPDYIRNKSLASKDRAPHTSFDHNTIASLGRKPSNSLVQPKYGREVAIGSFATAALLAAAGSRRSPFRSIKTGPALNALKNIRTATKVGIPVWTAAGGVAAVDDNIGQISDSASLKKGDVYKGIAKDVASAAMNSEYVNYATKNNKYAELSKLIGRLTGYNSPFNKNDSRQRKPDTMTAAMFPSKEDTLTEAQIKKLLLGLAITPKDKIKSGILPSLKYYLQRTNLGYNTLNYGLKQLGKNLTTSSRESLSGIPTQQKIEDLVTGNVAQNEGFRRVAKALMSGKTPKGVPENLIKVIQGMDTSKAIRGIGTSVNNRFSK